MSSSSWVSRHGDYEPRENIRRFDSRELRDVAQDAVPNKTAKMPWSWRLGRVAGIDVYIHATFLILLGWILMIEMAHGSTWVEAGIGIAYVIALFSCVVLHELGHALTARRYGIKTLDITLLPIGGLARLERLPKVPQQELAIALAGPAVNVVIGGLLFCVIKITGLTGNVLSGSALAGGNPLVSLMTLNFWLAIFNLLPAFPMDGGRVLRALLALRVSRLRATQIASRVGQGMAVLFAIAGLMINPFLLLIALFVYQGAAQEYQMLQLETVMEGLRAQSVMVTDFRALKPTDTIMHAVDVLLNGSQHDFPVIDDNLHVLGLLLRQDLIAALSKDGGSAQPVGKIMRRAIDSVDADTPLMRAFEVMQESKYPVLPVVNREGLLVGLLTMENLAEVMMIKNAIQEAKDAHQRQSEYSKPGDGPEIVN
jgi:Zn-dependent protease/CBS domain-containing protein